MIAVLTFHTSMCKQTLLFIFETKTKGETYLCEEALVQWNPVWEAFEFHFQPVVSWEMVTVLIFEYRTVQNDRSKFFRVRMLSKISLYNRLI